MAEEKRKIVVFYHDNCIDGAASLWCFQHKYDGDPNVELTAFALSHGDAEERDKIIFKNIYADSEVYFVDIAPSEDELKKLFSPKEGEGKDKEEPWAKNVHIWDHHGSEIKRLNKFLRGRRPGPKDFEKKPSLDKILDKDAPAAVGIVWKQLFPNEDMPEFLRFVEKMDRSTGLRTTEDRAVAASMGSKNISGPDQIRQTFNKFSGMDLKQIEQEGHAIRSAQLNEMTKLQNAFIHTCLQVLPGTDPVWVPIVNTNLQMHGRGIHETMVEEGRKGPGPGIAMSWYVDGGGVVQLSVQTDGTPSAAKIAQHLAETIGASGGGHDEMAGVQFESLEQFFKGVPLYNEDQRLAKMFEPKKTTKTARPRNRQETPAPDTPSHG
ncbi:MAG: hypothetical protein GC137_06020 [Alphaproteobacteria bacterium]|nr:hypothetical protein [Alphaproteobacteria bacterium]